MAAGRRVEKGEGEFKMKLTTISYDKKSGKLCFLLEGVDVSIANALRRAAVEEVPVMAIEDVELRKNSSALYDEIVAHRLGLLPLTTDLKSYVLPSECKCNGEGCGRCTVKLTLEASSQGSVYASEIKTNDPKIKPCFPETLILKLLKGQRIEFEATACLGRGKEHMKWSPGLTYYKLKPMLAIDSAKVKNPEDIAEHCPKGVLETKNGKLVVNQEKIYDCDLCGDCEKRTEGAVRIEKNSTDFVFYVESWGQLEPKDIVSEAIEILEGKAAEFEKKIKE